MFAYGKSEIRALSIICTNFSAVFLASLVIPAFTGGFDIRNWPVILLGLGFTIVTAILAMLFAKKGKL